MRKSLPELIADHGGPESVHFVVPMQKRKEFLFLRYTDSDTPFEPVVMRISEERYRIDENYKITLVADNPEYGREDFYQLDLMSLLRENKFAMYAADQQIEIHH